MTTRQAAITTILAILTLLAGIQLATRIGEYAECVNTRLHASTSYAADRSRIEEACKKLHLTFPF